MEFDGGHVALILLFAVVSVHLAQAGGALLFANATSSTVASTLTTQTSTSTTATTSSISSSSTSTSTTQKTTSITNSSSLTTEATTTLLSSTISATTMPTTVMTVASYYTVELFTNHPGHITFNGVSRTSNTVLSVPAGKYQISAVSANGFIFSNWSANGIAISNVLSPNTVADVTCNGLIIANYNLTTTFTENGLPTNTTWSVTYSNTTKTSMKPSITFVNAQGNYTYITKNAFSSNSIYLPSPTGGKAAAGSVVTVNYMATINNTATPIYTNQTTSVVVTTSTTIPYPNTARNPQSIGLNSSINSRMGYIISMLNGTYGKHWIYIINQSIAAQANSSTNLTGQPLSIDLEPIPLSVTDLGNMTALDNSQFGYFMSVAGPSIGNDVNTSIVMFNRSISVPYGKLKGSGRAYPAGTGGLHYVALNRHGIMTVYNVSVVKAAPVVNLTVNGMTYRITNTTGKTVIRVPIITANSKALGNSRPLSPTMIMGSIGAKAVDGNRLQYMVSVSTTGQRVNDTLNNFTMPINLPLSGNTSVSIAVNGNSNYSSFDPDPIIVPVGIVAYLQLTISNSQSSAVSTNTQIMVPFNAGAYQSYEATGLQNVEFFNGTTGNIVPSWMEGNVTAEGNPSNLYACSNVIYWITPHESIPASSSDNNIYVGFVSTSTNLLSPYGNTGEAPYLSSTYGQYDNGANIFLAYANGDTPTSSFSLSNGYTMTNKTSVSYYGSNVINALQLSGKLKTNNEPMFALSTALPNEPLVQESNWDIVTPGSLGLAGFGDSSNPSAVLNGEAIYSTGSYIFIEGYMSGGAFTGSQHSCSTGYATNTWFYSSLTYTGPSGTSFSGYSDKSLYGPSPACSGSVSVNPLSGVSNLYLSPLTGHAAIGSILLNFNWMRARVDPPNGVMPGVTFGSVQVPSTCSILLNTNTIAFGNVNPGNSVPTNKQIQDSNSGSAGASVYVLGTNWVSGSNTIGVSNTLWSASSQTGYTGTALTGTAFATGITAPAGGSADIYFGMGVPASALSGNYQQTITIENSC